MKEKILWVINMALILTAIFLVLDIFDIELPSVGKAFADDTPTICIAHFKDHTSLINIDLCCSEMKKQLRCDNWEEKVLVDKEEFDVDKRCYTGESTIDYFVNSQAYNYCN